MLEEEDEDGGREWEVWRNVWLEEDEEEDGGREWG